MEFDCSTPPIEPYRSDQIASRDALPRSVEAIVHAWIGFKNANDAYKAALKVVREREASERDPQRELSEIVRHHDCNAQRHVDAVWKNAENSLRWIAEAKFSAPGASLEIGDCSECTASHCETFDPVAMWRYLESRYCGSAGRNVAYSAAARALASVFDLRQGDVPKIVGGRTVLVLRAYPDEGRLSCSGLKDIEKAMQAIEAAGEWAEIWTQSHKFDVNRLLEAARHWSRYEDRSVQRTTIAELVLIVPFKCKWEFRIAPEFAEKIQLFLSEYDAIPAPR